MALADALLICRMYRQLPPEWLAEAAASLITKQMTPLQKRRRREHMIHLIRWDMVKDAQAALRTV